MPSYPPNLQIAEPEPKLDPVKLRLLAAAESLFAVRPIESVSLREIAVRAGNGNNNAVQYHFGSKDALVQAIFSWRVAEMEQPRAAMFEAAKAAGRENDMHALAEILCLPLLDLVDEEGRHTYAAFLGQYLLRHRPAGLGHAADYANRSTVMIRRVQQQIAALANFSVGSLGDYRLGLAHLLFVNMLVLSDNEALEKRDPPAFSRRVEETLQMVVKALRP